MILLKTFPLSLSIFWRFMLVLPLWTLFYFFLSTMIFLTTFSILGSIPILGIILVLIMPIVSTIIGSLVAMHPYLIGIGIGLRILGHETEISQQKLMKAAIGYGIAERLIVISLAAIIYVALLWPEPFVLENFRQIKGAQTLDPFASLSQHLVIGGMTTIAIISACLTLVFRAAFLPVLASVAAGRSQRGGSHSAFDGFCAKLPLMILILLIITGLTTLLRPFLFQGSAVLGLTHSLLDGLDHLVRFIFSSNFASLTPSLVLTVIGTIFISVWLFSLQCAGAALVHSGETSRSVAPTSKLPPINTEDISALRRARMGKKQ